MINRFATQPRFRLSSFCTAKAIAVARIVHLLLLLGAICFSLGRACGQEVQVPTGSSSDTGSSGGGSDGGGGTQLSRWKLPVKISASVNLGYDDNPNGYPSGSHGSISTGASIGLSYEFGTLRTRASLQTGTGFTYFPDLNTNRYDPNLFLNLTVNHQVNLRMSLATSISVNYQSEPDFSTNLSSDRRMGNYFSTGDSITLTYQWLPRFSTVTSYSLGTVLYDDRAVADMHNRFDNSINQSIRFLYLPVTTLVAQYNFSASVYDGGTGRNSYTNSFLLGFDHTFSEKLQGFLRGGFEFLTTSGAAFQSNDGLNPHFEAGLSYAMTGKTSLSWNASYAIQQSYAALAPGSLTFSTGLVGSYTVTPRIHANVSCYYRHDDNGGVEIFPGLDTSFTEQSIDLSLSLSYMINRFLSANVGYSHTEILSDLPDRSYSRNSVSGGLSVTF